MAEATELQRPDPKAVPLRALKVLKRVIDGRPEDDDNAMAAIDSLLAHFHLNRCSGDCGDDTVSFSPGLDGYEMAEALARAQRGEVVDCVIHLGRALPQRYAGIADALEKALGGVR